MYVYKVSVCVHMPFEYQNVYTLRILTPYAIFLKSPTTYRVSLDLDAHEAKGKTFTGLGNVQASAFSKLHFDNASSLTSNP